MSLYFVVMKPKVLSILFVSVVLILSCRSTNEKQIYLSKPDVVHLTNLSSASGIGYYNNTIYVVGDDVPWLYQLDTNLVVKTRTQVSAYDTLFKKRTPKRIKADFEGAEIVITDDGVSFVIVSSGSSKITRDTAFVVDILDPSKSISKNIRPLYERIKTKANLPSANEINIEGISFSSDDVYLLHRGNVSENIIIKIDRLEFINYLTNDGIIPEIIIYSFSLPEYKGVKSGFSGACLLPDESGLLFTASMEDTNDEINDGKVLGSFVGVIPLAGLDSGDFIASLLLLEGQPCEKKLEGIAVRSVNKRGEIGVITVWRNWRYYSLR